MSNFMNTVLSASPKNAFLILSGAKWLKCGNDCLATEFMNKVILKL